jgi:hypothetical protein
VKKRVRWLPIVIGLFVVNWIAAGPMRGTKPKKVNLPYTSFIEQVTRGNVVSISSRGATIQGVLKTKITYPGSSGTKNATDPKPVNNDEERVAFEQTSISEHTRELVDSEIRGLLDDCEQQAHILITANEDKLDRLVKALLEHETLDEIDAYRTATVAQLTQR